MAYDFYAAQAPAAGMPARQAFAIVPGQPIATLPAVIYVGGAGDITLRPVDSSEDVTYVGVPAGSYLTVRASAVRAAGTTATNLIGEV